MTDYIANFDLKRNHLTFDGEVCKNKLQADLIVKTGDKHFVYTQAASSNVWVIHHGLNKKPSVTVVDSAESVVIPDDIKYDSLNTCTVYFLASFTGKAYLN